MTFAFDEHRVAWHRPRGPAEEVVEIAVDADSDLDVAVAAWRARPHDDLLALRLGRALGEILELPDVAGVRHALTTGTPQSPLDVAFQVTPRHAAWPLELAILPSHGQVPLALRDDLRVVRVVRSLEPSTPVTPQVDVGVVSALAKDDDRLAIGLPRAAAGLTPPHAVDSVADLERLLARTPLGVLALVAHGVPSGLGLGADDVLGAQALARVVRGRVAHVVVVAACHQDANPPRGVRSLWDMSGLAERLAVSAVPEAVVFRGAPRMNEVAEALVAFERSWSETRSVREATAVLRQALRRHPGVASSVVHVRREPGRG